MPQKLIIIRGNSGSGKSTIATRVRKALGGNVMFLQQDVLRREILGVKDKAGNPTIGLIERLALYGRDNEYDVLLEGILPKDKYGEMLKSVQSEFEKSYVYYLDISFEETLRRHNLRPENSEFGETQMREWWNEKDYLGVEGERLVLDDLSVDEVVKLILEDVSR